MSYYLALNNYVSHDYYLALCLPSTLRASTFRNRNSIFGIVAESIRSIRVGILLLATNGYKSSRRTVKSSISIFRHLHTFKTMLTIPKSTMTVNSTSLIKKFHNVFELKILNTQQKGLHILIY